MPSIILPTSTAGMIAGNMTAIFGNSGVSKWIIAISAIIFLFWILEILIENIMRSNGYIQTDGGRYIKSVQPVEIMTADIVQDAEIAGMNTFDVNHARKLLKSILEQEEHFKGVETGHRDVEHIEKHNKDAHNINIY